MKFRRSTHAQCHKTEKMKLDNEKKIIGVLMAVLLISLVIFAGLTFKAPYEKYEEVVIIEEIKYGTTGNEFKCNSSIMEGWVIVYFKIGNVDIGDTVKIYWVKEGFNQDKNT